MSDEIPSKIKVRFAPSPTGRLHLGGGRTALFNWLFARKNGGIYILRVEDTDKERSTKEYETEIIEALRWLGLDWDEGVTKERAGESYRQTERLGSYHKYLEKLLEDKKAYWCYCTKEELEADKAAAAAKGEAPNYVGRCRDLLSPPDGREPQVIRFKTQPAIIKFKDMIRGDVEFDSSLVDDFVIAKGLDSPLYNFAVIVDDFEMNITHVIRGEEHLSNTPRQILMQQALDMPSVIYAHLPLILNAQRGKLSKREADVSLLSYRDKGYLPQAMINFLVLMGWHPSGDQEVFTEKDLIAAFDITRVQKAGAVFNEEKLNWLNHEHIKLLSLEELETALEPFMSEKGRSASRELRQGAIAAVRDRLYTLKDFSDPADFFFELPEYPAELIIWKKGTKEEALKVLEELKTFFFDSSSISADTLPSLLATLTDKYGKGNVLWPLRVALSGLEASPDPFTIAAVLGKQEILRRLDIAKNKLA